MKTTYQILAKHNRSYGDGRVEGDFRSSGINE